MQVVKLSSGRTRDDVLAAVDAIAERLEASVLKDEALRGPSEETLAALCEADLIGIKSPREVGGLEADWTLQTEVLERVAYRNLAAAWCLMLYFDNTGKALSALSDEGVARLMSKGRIPVICGGGGLKMGVLKPVEGGYRLSGEWIFGSGIPQAEYVMMSAVDTSADPSSAVRQVVVPVSEIDIADNWHVMGLKGTGSSNFSARDVFVPSDMVADPTAPPLRGGALFRLGWFGYAGLCMPAVMNGAARRALDEIAAQASGLKRGYVARTSLGDRGFFKAFLGEADLKLKAARALAIEMGAKVLRDAEQLGHSPARNEAEARAVGTYCAGVAIEIVNKIVKFAGSSGVQAGHLFERTLRDLHMAGTHMFVSEVAYENLADFLMNRPDAKLVA